MSISDTVNLIKEQNKLSTESVEVQKNNTEVLNEIKSEIQSLKLSTEFAAKNTRLDNLEKNRKETREKNSTSRITGSGVVKAVKNPLSTTKNMASSILDTFMRGGAFTKIALASIAGVGLGSIVKEIKNALGLQGISLLDIINKATKDIFGTALFGKQMTEWLKNIPSLSEAITSIKNTVSDFVTSFETEFPLLKGPIKLLSSGIKLLTDTYVRFETYVESVFGELGIFEKSLAAFAAIKLTMVGIKAALLGTKMVGGKTLRGSISTLSTATEKLTKAVNRLSRRQANNRLGGPDSANNNSRNARANRGKWWTKLLNKGSLAAVVGTIATVGGFASMMPGFGGDGDGDGDKNNQRNNGSRSGTGSQVDRPVVYGGMTTAQADARRIAMQADSKLKMLYGDIFKDPGVPGGKSAVNFAALDILSESKPNVPGRVGPGNLASQLVTESIKPKGKIKDSLLYSLIETKGPRKVASKPLATIMLETESPKVKPTTGKLPTLDIMRQTLFPSVYGGGAKGAFSSGTTAAARFGRNFEPDNIAGTAPKASSMRFNPQMGRNFVPDNITGTAPKASLMGYNPQMGRRYIPGNVAATAPRALLMGYNPGMGRNFVPDNIAGTAPRASLMGYNPAMSRGYTPGNVDVSGRPDIIRTGRMDGPGTAQRAMSKEYYKVGFAKDGTQMWGEKGKNSDGSRYSRFLDKAKSMEINADLMNARVSGNKAGISKKYGSKILKFVTAGAGMVGAAVSAPITAAALTATGVALTAYDAYTGASGALSNLGPNASTGEKAKAATIGGGEGILRGIFGGIDFMTHYAGKGIDYIPGTGNLGQTVSDAAILLENYNKLSEALHRNKKIYTDDEINEAARSVIKTKIRASAAGFESQYMLEQANEKNRLLFNSNRIPHPMGASVEYNEGGTNIVQNNNNFSGDGVPASVDASDVAIEVR